MTPLYKLLWCHTLYIVLLVNTFSLFKLFLIIIYCYFNQLQKKFDFIENEAVNSKSGESSKMDVSPEIVEDELWVEKYRPKRYLDLLSDEVIYKYYHVMLTLIFFSSIILSCLIVQCTGYKTM